MTTNPEFRTYLIDGQATILQEIADPKVSKQSLALTYGFLMKGNECIEWGIVNRALIERFGENGLIAIKKLAVKP